MHGSRAENAALIDALLQPATIDESVECLVCPPFVYLSEVGRVLAGSPVALGAQNVCAEGPGAFTGEVAASMLVDVGCRYVLVGHSERRVIYGENDALVARKFAMAQSRGLTPVLCVGEQLAERDGGQTEAVVARQLDAVLARIPRRRAYYPGAEERYARFTGRKPEAGPPGTLPWTLVRDVARDSDPHYFEEESFVCVCAETALDAATPEAFLEQVPDFVCNGAHARIGAETSRRIGRDRAAGGVARPSPGHFGAWRLLSPEVRMLMRTNRSGVASLFLALLPALAPVLLSRPSRAEQLPEAGARYVGVEESADAPRGAATGGDSHVPDQLCDPEPKPGDRGGHARDPRA